MYNLKFSSLSLSQWVFSCASSFRFGLTRFLFFYSIVHCVWFFFDVIVLFSLCFDFVAVSAVSVLDESDVESICSADFLPKSTPINVLSKLRSSRLQPIADSVDLEHYRKSAFDLNTGSQLSLCNSSSIESVVDEIEKSLHLGFNHDELKQQLLKRCKQTDVLPFDEIYSAR